MDRSKECPHCGYKLKNDVYTAARETWGQCTVCGWLVIVDATGKLREITIEEAEAIDDKKEIKGRPEGDFTQGY
jgi:hypothetical protein